MRHHTLFFLKPHGVPDWLHQIAECDPDRARRLHLDRSIADAERYAGRAASFDVLNEAIGMDSNNQHHILDHFLLGSNPILSIKELFDEVARVAPNTELTYNDVLLPPYLVDTAAEVCEWACRRLQILVRTLGDSLDAGAPIHAVGIQSHLTNNWNEDWDLPHWGDSLETLESMGLRVIVTELDALDCQLGVADRDQRHNQAADQVRTYLNETLTARSIRDVVCWGLSDASTPHSCDDRDEVSAHPYDENLQPKPMAEAMIEAFRNAPDRED